MSGPFHIDTLVYDEYNAQGTNATASQVSQLATYAQSGLGNNKAPSDCDATIPKGCSSIFYADPNFVYDSTQCPYSGDSQVLAAAAEDWWVHLSGYTDSSHRVHGTYNQTCNGSTSSIPVYALNEANAGVQSYYRTYFQQNADSYDIVYMDDAKGTVGDQFYGPGGGFCAGICSTTQEQPSNAAVTSAHQTFASMMTHTNGSPMTFWFNGYSYDGGAYPNDTSMVGGNITGASCENCVVSFNALQAANYARAINGMISAASAGGTMLLISTGYSTTNSATQITDRLVSLGVTWLGYSEGHAALFDDLEMDTRNLAIYPEELIYPSNPVETATASASDLAVTANVWRREFRACYSQGTFIGPCAVVVNGGSSSVTLSGGWFTQSYGHVLQLSGGDQLSGGSATFTGPLAMGGTTVPAGGAILIGP